MLTAARDARPFLKLESFRLLSILFSRAAGQSSTSELDTLGLESLTSNSGGVIRSVSLALQDEEMLKTKRVKELLKAFGKVVSFQKAQPDESLSKELREVRDCLEQVRTRSDNSGVKSGCEKLEIDVDDCLTKLEQVANGSGGHEKKTESNKKKKKKKGKKKK